MARRARSEKYHDVHPDAKAFAKQLKKDKAGLIKKLQTDLKSSK